ncbi:MAG: hypothetical protein JSW68_06140 [Burkholderiales bacterium]|nr:MAG: hypothetical protein JSW68_06140 [Burkholderiales bacterium]
MSRRLLERAALATLRRVPALREAARSLHGALVEQRELEADIPELTPLVARPSEIGALRINLLLPGASARHVFGGAATALRLMETLGAGLPQRVLVTDEAALEALDAVRFAGWQVRSAAEPDSLAPALVPLGDRAHATLPVGAGDRFIATAWWTAHHARSLVRWQRDAFGLSAAQPFVYLVQDYEPGFYPWSARHVLAMQTYGFAEPVLGVFNTSSLHRYFRGRGHALAAEYVFEPVLNPELAARLPSPGGAPRQRQLLVYGRPATPRNGFALIAGGLRRWVAEDPAAARWRMLSLGERHPDLDLGRAPGASESLRLESLGKVPLEHYAQLMRESAIGLALMLSPHPSYPPLEMAAFGMRAITNRFEGKALAGEHPNVVDLAWPDPESIAGALAQAAGDFEAHLQAPQARPWSEPPGAFVREDTPFPFRDLLCARWLGADAQLARGGADLQRGG